MIQKEIYEEAITVARGEFASNAANESGLSYLRERAFSVVDSINR